jgi:23S rRNA (uracil1939-C5)-methyltransferase
MRFNRLTIEKLVAGGMGLARTDRGVVFVADTAPGDVVSATLSGRIGGCPTAIVDAMIEPSPARVQPKCPYAGTCGGCDWQHISYQAQLDAKQAILAESLSRIGKIRPVPEIQMLPSPEWGYRIRAQFKIDRVRNAMGFFRRDSHEVVDIASCPLLAPSLNALLARKQEVMPQLPHTVRQIKAIAGDHGIAAHPAISGIAAPDTEIQADNRNFSVQGGGFFQGNGPLLSVLGPWARPWIAGDVCVDLYCGAGFFSVFLGDRFKTGLSIDSEESQVRQARANLARNGLEGWRAIAAEAGNAFAAGANRLPARVDCLIVDPPRPGLSEAVRQGIARLLPHDILYISCNPPTQARDARFFINACGYRIDRAAMFDLYPQTHHVESVLLFKRK